MSNNTEETPKYCTREIVAIAASGTEKTKLCYQKIEKKNPLNWCEECRAARLPFWPKDEAPVKELTAAG